MVRVTLARLGPGLAPRLEAAEASLEWPQPDQRGARLVVLDAPTQQLLTLLAERSGDAPPTWQLSAAQARVAADRRRAPDNGLPEVHVTDDLSFVSPDGREVAVKVLVPTARPAGFLLYFHGGGWVLGSAETTSKLGRALAVATNHVVALVDYAKAPEHPFPAALVEADAAVDWAATQLAAYGPDVLPLVVAGDSAGGNLAAVAVRHACERGGPPVSAQVLIYPITDSDPSRPSYAEAENQTLLPAPLVEWFWSHYLPDADRRGDPDAAPLRAVSLAGLPPALVVTGEHDVLRDEGEAYATRLAAAGVAVSQHRVEGQMHGFLAMVDALPASRSTLDLVGSYLAGIGA
ncbi:MAG: Alpha/beta hydrolase fold-3 domain protein [Frankiales bacterium]|nr:Alpha/beta hydrolase fold-3 domain protein [Frankiales bacterium]